MCCAVIPRSRAAAQLRPVVEARSRGTEPDARAVGGTGSAQPRVREFALQFEAGPPSHGRNVTVTAVRRAWLGVCSLQGPVEGRGTDSEAPCDADDGALQVDLQGVLRHPHLVRSEGGRIFVFSCRVLPRDAPSGPVAGRAHARVVAVPGAGGWPRRRDPPPQREAREGAWFSGALVLVAGAGHMANAAVSLAAKL